MAGAHARLSATAKTPAATGPLGLPILDGKHSPQNVALYSFVLGGIAACVAVVGSLDKSLPGLLAPLAAVPTFLALEYISCAVLLNLNGLDAFYFPTYCASTVIGLVVSGVAETLAFAAIFGSTNSFIAAAISRIGIAGIIISQLFRLVVLIGAVSDAHQYARWIADQSQFVFPYWKDARSSSMLWWLLSLQVALCCPATLIATVFARDQFTGPNPDKLDWPEVARNPHRHSLPSRASTNLFGLPLLDGRHTQQNIAIYGFGLGLVSGFGLGLGLAANLWRGFGFFLMFLAVFHTFEYITTAMFKPGVSLTSFLINHSREYHLAMAGGVIEFLVELWIFPRFKSFNTINMIGVVIAAASQLLRTLAMITAGQNFSHIIVEHRDENHHLVTNGIYAIFRHPSYAGFFYWSLALQIVLGNPICLVLYVPVLVKFFRNRITFEELTLREFFGDQYLASRAHRNALESVCGATDHVPIVM